MKKTFRLISMFLALLTVALTLPLTVAAETDATTTQDGDVLIQLENLFDVDASSDSTTKPNHIVTCTNTTYDNDNGQFQLSTSAQSQAGETIYAGSTLGNVAGGLWTDLPHGTGKNYTIEFYLKSHTDTVPAFYYCGETDYYGLGCYFRSSDVYSINTRKIDTTTPTSKFNGKFGDVENGKNAYIDSDGYIRFVIELKGWDTTVYVGGTEVGTKNISTSATNHRYQYLSLMVSLNSKDTGCKEDDPLVSVKDITVYQGCIADTLNNRVEFTKDGELLKPQANISTNTVLNETDFPTVTPATGKAVKWFIKNTNKIVSAPYTVTNDLMLEAREVDLLGTEVVGMQYTENNGSTQSIRFLATLHSLDFSKAGFKIEAKYMETDPETQESVLKTRAWNVTSDIVYTEIQAETDAGGTVETITANELGGTYLIAIAINDVPTTIGQIDFYVTACAGDSVTSEQVVFHVKDGVADRTLSSLEAPSAN